MIARDTVDRKWELRYIPLEQSIGLDLRVMDKITGE
jgi:hypothetical protein